MSVESMDRSVSRRGRIEAAPLFWLDRSGEEALRIAVPATIGTATAELGEPHRNAPPCRKNLSEKEIAS